MGIDYDGVGGIGIELTDEMLDTLKQKGLFTEEEWDEDYYDCMEKIGLVWEPAHYYDVPVEEYTFYLFVDGNNIVEINDNIPSFLDTLNKYGFNITKEDIIPISDIHIW